MNHVGITTLFTHCPFYVAILIKNGLNIFSYTAIIQCQKKSLELALDTALLVKKKEIFLMLYSTVLISKNAPLSLVTAN